MDKNEFAALYEANKQIVLWMAWKLSWVCKYSQTLDLDDLRQEGFLAMVAAWETFRGESADWTKYLRTSIRNRIYRLVRRRRIDNRTISINRRMGVDNPVELLDLIPAKVSPVDARILAEGNAREIRDALAELTDAQRESIRLCYLDGLGVVETSKRMGVSQKMTRKQLDAGINRLRLRLCEGASRDDSGAAGYRRGIYRDADAGRGTL